MMHMTQVKEFYRSLSDEEKKDLCEAIAEDIYFLDEGIQADVLALMEKAEPEISARIRQINSFTI